MLTYHDGALRDSSNDNFTESLEDKSWDMFEWKYTLELLYIPGTNELNHYIL